jgi:hypothetical protein
MDSIPLIRLEIERMKYGITTALTQHQLLLDQEFQQAVEKFCTPENISRIVKSQVDITLEQVIREEVVTYFKVGPGREAITEAVEEKLKASFQTFGEANESCQTSDEANES